MTLQTITLSGQPVEVLSMPPAPAPRMVEPWITDPVAESTSPWTGQTQRQRFPGNDQWGLNVTMPPIAPALQGQWIAWLMGMRGKQRAVRMPDPLWQPIASSLRGSAPVIDGRISGDNAAGSTVLRTRGWATGKLARVLEPGEQFALGERLYRAILPVLTNIDGNAAFEIWPSLREVPADGTPLVFTTANSFVSPGPGLPAKQRGPTGLFSLAENKRNWSADISRLMRLSFALKEYR